MSTHCSLWKRVASTSPANFFEGSKRGSVAIERSVFLWTDGEEFESDKAEVESGGGKGFKELAFFLGCHSALRALVYGVSAESSYERGCQAKRTRLLSLTGRAVSLDILSHRKTQHVPLHLHGMGGNVSDDARAETGSMYPEATTAAGPFSQEKAHFADVVEATPFLILL